MKIMKRIFLIILTAVLLIMPATYVFAQSETSGKLTNFPVGTCKEINDVLWQQLSDGTWAPPEDKLNTCLTGGFPQNWINNPQYNPFWQTQYSQNYGMQNMDQRQWFLQCVLTQSIVPRPECQVYPGNWLNYNYGWNQNNWWNQSQLGQDINRYLWYPRWGRNYYHFQDKNYDISLQVPQENKTLNSILFGLSMGWIFNRLTS
jgi:hypothetical protein